MALRGVALSFVAALATTNRADFKMLVIGKYSAAGCADANAKNYDFKKYDVCEEESSYFKKSAKNATHFIIETEYTDSACATAPLRVGEEFPFSCTADGDEWVKVFDDPTAVSFYFEGYNATGCAAAAMTGTHYGGFKPGFCAENSDAVWYSDGFDGNACRWDLEHVTTATCKAAAAPTSCDGTNHTLFIADGACHEFTVSKDFEAFKMWLKAPTDNSSKTSSSVRVADVMVSSFVLAGAVAVQMM